MQRPGRRPAGLRRSFFVKIFLDVVPGVSVEVWKKYILRPTQTVPLSEQLMKIRYLALIFAFALSANTLRAVPPSLPTFSFHENGNGQLELPILFGGGVIPLPGTLMPDPGPGGLLNVLTFTAHPQLNPFPVGDVVLLDAGGDVSDILRFNPATTSSSGLTQLIFFYSNDQGGLLADTGLPSGLYDNKVTIQESQSGPTIYTPTAGQPGFSTDSPLGDAFHIFSTPDTGSTLCLLGLAVSGLGLLRRSCRGVRN
jgi:hypothetical protein